METTSETIPTQWAYSHGAERQSSLVAHTKHSTQAQKIEPDPKAIIVSAAAVEILCQTLEANTRTMPII